MKLLSKTDPVYSRRLVKELNKHFINGFKCGKGIYSEAKFTVAKESQSNKEVLHIKNINGNWVALPELDYTFTDFTGNEICASRE